MKTIENLETAVPVGLPAGETTGPVAAVSIRKELIERLHDYDGTHDHDCVVDAAAMLEADAVPQEPVAYLAWRDGKPCWEGDDCVCQDAVWPVDHDDDRTSMPVYLAAPQQQPRLTDAEIDAIADESIGYSREINKHYFARLIEKKVRGEA